MIRHRLPAGFATCALLLGTGCGNPCIDGRPRTEAALSSAREARADLYALRELRQAEESSRQADEECRRQRSHLAVFRSYRLAEALFDGAQRGAEGAREKAKIGQGLARQEAFNARYIAGMAVNEALVALRRAKEMKGNAWARVMVGRLDGLRLALGELQKRIDAEDYLAARELGEKIQAEAVRLQADANRMALPAGPR